MVLFNIACVFNLIVCIFCIDEVTRLLVEEVKALKTELSTLKKSCVMKSDYTDNNVKRFIVPSSDNPSEAVAFSAFLSTAEKGPSIGKLHTIVYDQIELNVAAAYDRFTGTFRAPAAGIYAFTWTIFAVGGRSHVDLGEIKTELVVNGQVHGSLHADTETNYDDDSATGFVINALNKGDDVFIRSAATHEGYAPQGILVNGNMRWTFSGWLIK